MTSLTISLPGSWSQDHAAMSQDRNGCPQIQGVQTASSPVDTIIHAMSDTSRHPLTDWPSDPPGYTSAYPSSHTNVYSQPREVS